MRQHGSELLPAYNETVTHVIVRVDEEKSAERTLKFLYGVAARKWIVSIDWVNQCLKEKRFVKEEPYEVLDMDGENGPWRARQTTKLLFQDFEFCCVEPFTDVTVQQLRQLLELCGALTVDHPANLTKSRRFSLIVMQADSISDQRKADVYNDRYKVITVSREWVLDCIASYQLYPLRTQIIGKIDLAALTKMGFAHLLDWLTYNTLNSFSSKTLVHWFTKFWGSQVFVVILMKKNAFFFLWNTIKYWTIS